MIEELQQALATGHGIVVATDFKSSWMLSNAVRGGHLERIFPGVFVDTRSKLDDLRHRAALRYLAGKDAVFSHLTALALWGLRPQPTGEPLHATVSRDTRVRAAAGLLVHRSATHESMPRSWRSGKPVVRAAQALVDSWPLLPRERVGLVLRAVDRRIAGTGQIHAVLGNRPQTEGAGALRILLGQIDQGCRSQLEIWGMLWVFTGPGMPPLRRQFAVRAKGKVYYLDVYAESEQVAFELDGAAHHGSKEQREADLVRDAALATVGIRVVRYAYSRLVAEPEAVRREVLAILAAARPRS